MKDIERILYTEEQIKAKVAELGRQITRDYEGKNLLLCCILKGSLVFMSDLMRQIDLPLTIDFMKVSSYGHGTESSGDVRVLLDLSVNLPEYDLLIVEDIFDSGRTLAPFSQSPSGIMSSFPSTISALNCRTSSSSVMGSTMRSTTATSPISAF